MPTIKVSLDPDHVVIESNVIFLEELKLQEDFNIRTYPEAVYLGKMNKEEERHGPGVMKYSNGRQYEGGWENDKRSGKGFERYANGNTYYGMFLEGKAHGKGVYTWKNG